MSSDVTDAHPDIPWSDMAKVRDRLSHRYHRIDPSQLWTMATQDVPVVVRLLREIAPGD
jgi:uncharacterized protein with HEPN domain